MEGDGDGRGVAGRQTMEAAESARGMLASVDASHASQSSGSSRDKQSGSLESSNKRLQEPPSRTTAGSSGGQSTASQRTSATSRRTSATSRRTSATSRTTSTSSGPSSGTSDSHHRSSSSSSGTTTTASSSSGDTGHRSSVDTSQGTTKSDESGPSVVGAIPEETEDELGQPGQPGQPLEQEEQLADLVAVGEVPVVSEPSTPSWPGSEADWDEEKWLKMADFYDAQRRPTTMADWEARKHKYPELYRSDVSVCPSYSQYQVPYWSVCWRRSQRAMRRINRQLAREVEELALLQTRALDGVRVVRCFSLGARPHPPPPDPLSDKERRKLEQLLA